MNWPKLAYVAQLYAMLGTSIAVPEPSIAVSGIPVAVLERSIAWCMSLMLQRPNSHRLCFLVTNNISAETHVTPSPSTIVARTLIFRRTLSTTFDVAIITPGVVTGLI